MRFAGRLLPLCDTAGAAIPPLRSRHLYPGAAGNPRTSLLDLGRAVAARPFLPLSGGPSICGVTGESAPQTERLERRMGHLSAVLSEGARAIERPCCREMSGPRAALNLKPIRALLRYARRLAGAVCPGAFLRGAQ